MEIILKEVYKEYLVTLDDEILIDEFNIKYSEKKKRFLDSTGNEISMPVEGFLKLKFDYQDNLLPRSIVSFYYSNDGSNWNQIRFRSYKWGSN